MDTVLAFMLYLQLVAASCSYNTQDGLDLLQFALVVALFLPSISAKAHLHLQWASLATFAGGIFLVSTSIVHVYVNIMYIRHGQVGTPRLHNCFCFPRRQGQPEAILFDSVQLELA